MLNRNSLFYIALFITLILFFIEKKLTAPPAVKPITVASNEFSGERAFNLLSNLLRENEPHPVGSPLNRVVKERILDELNKHNIENSVQRTWACSNSLHRCAFVENIIAIIPGKSESGYVTLISHYDSVPVSSGAGDDGAAVAGMLETGRILKAEAPHDKPIMLLFTDAEENGLIGAEAFFRQHPLAKKVSVVLNFEGSGTKGISQVIRTSGANKLIIDAYGNQTSYPRGYSLTNEVLERMSNDTDFSVVRRANVPGIDLAFAQERNHYHTPNDNLENIDHRTIQHHGENMLPTTRWLANNDFSSAESSVFSHLYNGWTQWPASYTPMLILSSFILLVVAYMRSNTPFRGVFKGLQVTPLVLVASILVPYGAFQLIASVHGTTVSWPAYDLPYRIVLFSSGFLGGLLIALVSNKYLEFHQVMLGACFAWLALAIALYLYTPVAANLIVLPLIVISLVYAISSFFSEQITRYALLLSLVFVVPTTLGLVLPLETSQGYRLIIVTMPLIALFMTIFVPLIHGANLKLPLSATTITLAIALIFTIHSPLYSEHRPQHVNIIYFEQLGTDEGYYWLQHRNPLPEPLQTVHEWSSEKKALIPYSTLEYSNWYQSEASGFEEVQYTIKSDQSHDAGRTLELGLTSPRNARTIELVLPATTKLASFRLEGNEFKPQQITDNLDERYYFLRFDGVYEKEVPLTLELGSSEPIEAFLIDRSTELPRSASKLLEQRSKVLSPQHTGDRAILIKTITL